MRSFTTSEAKEVGDKLGVDWTKIPLDQFRMGLKVELEHGKVDAQTDVTHDSLMKTGKIAWAHLKESDRYYTDLDAMEKKEKALKAKSESFELRMLELLGEATLPSGEQAEDSQAKYIKAAQILVVGLNQELPDNQSEAVDYMMDIFRTLIRKRVYLNRALRIRNRKSQARAFLQKVRRGL